MRLQNTTAFITGGSSGIGLAAAKAFVREGAFVTITGRQPERVAAAVAEIGEMATGFAVDISDDEAMVLALAAAARRTSKIDTVFANAGYYVHSALGKTTRFHLEEQFSVVTGGFMTVQAALPHMHKGASIILMGSVYASMGPPGASAYAASKAAMAAMARSMASELSPLGIRVNTVVPGAVDTPGWSLDRLEPSARSIHKERLGERALLNRMITADEVANAVVFLASSESSGLQAAEIVVDGGTTGALAGSPRFMRGEPE